MRLLLICCILLVACLTPEQEVAQHNAYKNDQAALLGESLNYFRDERTGACFAGLWLGSHQTTITFVPCEYVHEDPTSVLVFRSKSK